LTCVDFLTLLNLFLKFRRCFDFLVFTILGSNNYSLLLLFSCGLKMPQTSDDSFFVHAVCHCQTSWPRRIMISLDQRLAYANIESSPDWNVFCIANEEKMSQTGVIRQFCLAERRWTVDVWLILKVCHHTCAVRWLFTESLTSSQ